MNMNMNSNCSCQEEKPIGVTTVLGAAPKKELERLLQELEPRLGNGAGAKEPALRGETEPRSKNPKIREHSGSPSLLLSIKK